MHWTAGGKQEEERRPGLLQDRAPLNAVRHDTGNAQLARRIGRVEAEPTACMECIAETPPGSFGAGKRSDSATISEDIRCGGRNFGTCPHEKVSGLGTMSSKVSARQCDGFEMRPRKKTARAITHRLSRQC
jgi:hypothetical protein